MICAICAQIFRTFLINAFECNIIIHVLFYTFFGKLYPFNLLLESGDADETYNNGPRKTCLASYLKAHKTM